MKPLEGEVALITGAKGGLGSFVTNAFLATGATVAGASRSIRDSDFDHPGFAAFPSTLSSLETAEALAEAVVSRFSRIDCLVHLVGGFAAAPVATTDAAVFEQMLDVNLRSTFYAIRSVLPVMRRQNGGRIVAIGSRAAVDNNAGIGAYSASKAALIALVRAVAIENKDHGITANVVMPGTMDTPANRAAMPQADPGAWVPPRDVAAVITSLTTDRYASVSGAVIPVYGREL